jgi:hypothetical protein
MVVFVLSMSAVVYAHGCRIDGAHVFGPAGNDAGVTIDDNGNCQSVSVKVLYCKAYGNQTLSTDFDSFQAAVSKPNPWHGQYSDHNGFQQNTWWGFRLTSHNPLSSDCWV